MHKTIVIIAVAGLAGAAFVTQQTQNASLEWRAYGGNADGTRFSSANQITPENVSRLDTAWTYRTGDLFERGGRFQVTPIVVGGTMYLATPLGTVIALDPVTGRERWRRSTNLDRDGRYGDWSTRGVAHWRAAGGSGACAERILFANVQARLWALDAATGAPCGDFGTAGEVDLSRVRNAPEYVGEYQVTSAPLVVGDVVITGSAIADNRRVAGPAGVVRAFNVRTGTQLWSWDPHPPPGAPGSETWRGPIADSTGGANAWATMTADAARGLVFVPTSSPSPDYYGGERLGANAHANSLVALRVTTGEVAWAYQMVHHDLWDYDLPAQPVLFTLRRDGRAIPAIAQTTKMGLVFILNRETGQPIFEVTERPVPRSTVPGETASPTQPFPSLPAPLVPHRLTAADAWGPTPADRAACTAKLTGKRAEGIYTPPSLEGTIVVPGNVGGSNWSGMTIDTTRGLLIANTNHLPALITLVPRAAADSARRNAGAAEFATQRSTPYGMLRELLLGPSGLPCVAPPWGLLTAINVATGARAWSVPLGVMVPQHPDGPSWGSLNLGGAITTGGGVTFIGASIDQRFRAFETATGRELWSAPLPAGGMATPMTYVGRDGRQYVVIAAGGHDRLPIPRSDHLIAFALPR